MFLLAEETALEWRGTEIEVSDLAVNDMVSITFAGEIQGTYPGTYNERGKGAASGGKITVEQFKIDISKKILIIDISLKMMQISSFVIHPVVK